MPRLLRIGQFAALLGVTPKTIRHYHALRLLDEPCRAENGYRVYPVEALVQVRQIQRLQEAGLSLRQIRVLLTLPEPRSAVRHALETQYERVTRELNTLHAQRRRLQVLLDDEDSWGRALQSSHPLPVPSFLTDALAKLDLPPKWLSADLVSLSETSAYRWPAAQMAQWQTELERMLRHSSFRTGLTALLGVLAEADQLSTTEANMRVAQIRTLIEGIDQQTSVPDVHAVLMATLSQLRLTADLTPGQERVLTCILSQA